MWKSWQASRWPEVEATILDSEVKSSFAGTHMSYEPAIRYTYEVAGRVIESASVEVIPGPTKYESYAANVVQQFPKGGIAKARYNPLDFAESYLLTGIRLRVVVVAVAPWLFFALSVCWLMERWNTARKGILNDALHTHGDSASLHPRR